MAEKPNALVTTNNGYASDSKVGSRELSSLLKLAGGSVRRSDLVRLCVNILLRHGLCSLVAAFGMGKHCLAAQVAVRMQTLGFEVRIFRFSRRSFDNSIRRLRKFSFGVRDACKGGFQVLALVEDIAPLDEDVVARAAQFIDSMVQSGAKVLVLLEPAAEMLLDDLPNTRVLRSQDLLVSDAELASWPSSASSLGAGVFSSITHRIPALASALCKESSSPVLGAPVTKGPLSAACSRLLLHALGPDLIEEERLLRAAMAALGNGTFEELALLGLSVSDELLSLIERDSPLFGVRVHDATFSLAACTDEDVARVLSESFQRQDWCVRFVDALVARGDYSRAAALCQTCVAEGDQFAQALAHPFEFFDVGRGAFVLSSLEASEHKNDERADVDVALDGLAALGLSVEAPPTEPSAGAHAGDGGPEARDANDSGGYSPAEGPLERLRKTMEPLRCGRPCGGKLAGRDRVRLQSALAQLSAIVRKDVGLADGRMGALLLDEGEGSGDRVCRCLAAHIRFYVLMTRGEYLEAFRRLMVDSSLRADISPHPTLLSCVLQEDFELVRRLLGDPISPSDDVALLCARDFLAERAPAKLAEDLETRRELLDGIERGERPPARTERWLAKMEQEGNAVALAFGHAAMAMSVAMAGAWRQATVRASEAGEWARIARLCDLELFSGLLRMMVSVPGGAGRGPRRISQKGRQLAFADMWLEGTVDTAICWDQPEEGPSREMKVLSDAVRAAVGGDGVALRKAALAMGEQAPGASTALAAECLASLDDVASRALLEVLPRTWRSPMSVAAYRGRASERPSRRVRAPRPPKTRTPGVSGRGPSGRPGLEVRLLGGFAAVVGGRPVPDDSWKRAASKTLLAMLAVAPGHSMGRFELVEALWPGTDFSRGKESLYSALSSLRKALGQRGSGVRYIVGEAGRVRLSEDCVSVDVDQFMEKMNFVAAGGSDAALVERCVELSGEYRGGIVPLASDANGMFRRCREELSRRYSDALVLGAEAALRMHDARRATWLAHAAAAETPLREDVEASLLRALVADGRGMEAVERYADYARRMVTEVGQPPSGKLRNLCRELGVEAGESGAATVRASAANVFASAPAACVGVGAAPEADAPTR